MNVKSLSCSEARGQFGEVLRRVARGEEIVITRRGKPVARIVPEGRDLDGVRNAINSMRKRRAELAKRKGFKPITDEEIRDAIQEGRR
jgi:prevent-host-death family protein